MLIVGTIEVDIQNDEMHEFLLPDYKKWRCASQKV